jgi:hypothetical protein
VVVVVELLGGGADCCTDELSSLEVVVVEVLCPAQPTNEMRMAANADDRMIFFICLLTW